MVQFAPAVFKRKAFREATKADPDVAADERAVRPIEL
jgi:hypothetical protein